jgi:hypothetical protein
MRGHPGLSRFAIAVTVCLPAFLPLLSGQGCDSTIIPTTGGLPGDTETSNTNGNVAPTFKFTAPLGNVKAEIGDTILVTWADSDPDNNAMIALMLDPDGTPDNGNEIAIATGISEDDPTNSLELNTGAYGLSAGTYNLVARITDGVNPEVLVSATGTLDLLPPGTNPGNVSPTVVVTAPTQTLSVADGSKVTITYCGHDADGGDGGVIADVLILLDDDDNPLNDVFADLDLESAAGASAIKKICASDMPVAVDGGVVLGCAKDDGCTNSAKGTNFDLTVSAAKIPQTSGGEPYRIRVSMWDHTNPPVNAYAQGTLSITSLASGTVDLKGVGRSITGAKFIGFDAGARAGFTGTSLGDFDGDGADDFITVARFGRPFERGNVGSAYMVYGTKGKRYGSDIYLNSFGTEYRGCGFAMGRTKVANGWLTSGDTLSEAADPRSTPVTEGITAVSWIEDLTGDGKPELLFSVPYAEEVYDYYDDDPCDKAALCYYDSYPNMLSNDKPANDDISAFDYREGAGSIAGYPCSNDGDLVALAPINQGYVFYVSSGNTLTNTIIDIALAGQKDPGGLILEEGTVVPGSSAPDGARLRGKYYSYLSGTDSDFGRTVGSMPDMSNGWTVPAKDGRPEFLISAPGAYGGRGMVDVIWGQDFMSFCTQDVKSIPDARKEGDCTRSFYVPDMRAIYGRTGDQLGYATRAGDFNRDGHQDILCGAPGATHGAVEQAGSIYIIFGRLDFGDLDLNTINPPRMEIHGTVTGDRFGETQTMLGDVNNDGFNDIAFASKLADGPGGVDCGYIGIIFGGRRLTGENTFTVNQVGTSQLPGVVFYGTQVGGNAGAIIADAGDFNHDGFDDLLINAPNEERTVNQTTRRGVAYLIFGGPHLVNGYHLLDEVGATTLPGIVFVSPYAVGTADEATIDYIGPAGDVDGDGFADVMIGISQADFVNPLEPSQRRNDAGETYLIYGSNSGTNVISTK